jgi:hypothetical protein
MSAAARLTVCLVHQAARRCSRRATTSWAAISVLRTSCFLCTQEECHPAALMKARYGVAGWDALKALWWRERRLQKATLGSKKYRWFSMAAKIFVLCTLFVRGAVSTDNTLRARAPAPRCSCHPHLRLRVQQGLSLGSPPQSCVQRHQDDFEHRFTGGLAVKRSGSGV